MQTLSPPLAGIKVLELEGLAPTVYSKILIISKNNLKIFLYKFFDSRTYFS